MNHPALYPRATLGPTRLSRAHRGFTLIELLTVIAIVGILAAIIIPVVGKVRQTAMRSECTSNLRQIGAATALFANDNKGFYPRAFTVINNQQVFWRELVVRGGYLGKPDRGMTTIYAQDQWRPTHFNVLICKAHRNAVPITNPAHEWLRPTYSMNGTLADGQVATWRPRIENLPSPSRLAYVGDGPEPSGSFGVEMNPAFWSGWSRPDAARAHNGVANILFFDGHVEARGAGNIPADKNGGAEASMFWLGR